LNIKTGACPEDCSYCSQSSKYDTGLEREKLMEIDQVLHQAKIAKDKGASRFCMGAAWRNPTDKSLDKVIPMIKGVKAMGMETCVTLGMITPKQASTLKEAGLDMLAGGGAEIFDPEIRNKICPEKISGDRWLEIIECAHKLGIKSNCTMLFGHIESPQHRIEHLDKLRKLQDKTGGFICFIPLPFIPHHSRLNIKKSISGIEKLKTIALSRIMLDNIPHIKSYWIMLGIKLAQAALYFGADDIDGTVVEEKIGHMAGANSPDVLTKNELIQMIKGCDLIPIERNGLFQYVK
jgi:aminodeoxyfutalosine synthase